MIYYSFWITILTLIPATWFWITPTLTELALLCAIGLLGVAGEAMVTHGLRQADATVLAPFEYSRIIYSAAAGYLLFGELPGAWSFVGMGLIVFSSLYLVLTEKRSRAGLRK